MGQPVSVIEKKSNIDNYVRFETNRTFTGMGHDSFDCDDEIFGETPSEMIAKVLFETGRVNKVHVYSQTIGVELKPGSNSDGLKESIEDLYTHYRPGVKVPDPSDF